MWVRMRSDLDNDLDFEEYTTACKYVYKGQNINNTWPQLTSNPLVEMNTAWIT